MNNLEIREKLFSLADEKIKEFSSKLTPGEENIIGVRVPLVRELAKEIAKGNYKEYLSAPLTQYHEECLLYGLVVGYIKCDLDEQLKYFSQWLQCVNNWAVCDCSVSTIKAFSKPQNKQKVFEYLRQILNNTDKPYYKRVCIVAMFSYFLDGTYDNLVANEYLKILDDHYYIKMALAWGISVIATKNYDLALQMIKNNGFDNFTHNKAIQKCNESFRLSLEQKQELKSLKR